MAVLENLVVRLTADVADFQKQMDNVGSKVQSMGRTVTNVGSKLTLGVTTPILGVGAAAFKMAADANEAATKMEAVFGGSTQNMNAWIAELRDTIPATTAQLQGMTSEIGDLLGPLGIAPAAAQDMTKSVVELAGDLASFNNIPVSEALERIRSGLVGQNEPLLKFGVAIDAATVKARALEMGLISEGEALDAASRAQAAFALILENTSAAHGDAAATAMSSANQLKFFWSQAKEAATILGTQLLPVITPIIAKMTEWIGRFQTLSPEIQKTIVVVGGLAAAIGPVLIVLGSMTTGLGVLVGALAAVSAPVLAVVAVLGTLVGAFTLAYKESETFRKVVDGAVSKTGKVVGKVLDGVMDSLTGLWEHFEEISEEIVETLDVVLIEPFLELWEMWGDEIMGIAKFVWDSVTTTFKMQLGILKSLASGAMSVISETIQLALNLIQGDWGEAWDNVVGIFEAVWETIVGIAESMWAAVGQVFQSKLQAIGDAVKAGLDRITGFFQGMKDVVVGNSIVPDMVDGVAAEFVRMGGEMETKTGAAVEAVTGSFEDLKGVVAKLPEGIAGPVGKFVGHFEDMKDDILGPVEEIAPGLTEALGGVLGALDLEGSFGDFDFKANIDKWAELALEIVDALKEVWGWIKENGGKVLDFFRNMNTEMRFGGDLGGGGVPDGGLPDDPSGINTGMEFPVIAMKNSLEMLVDLATGLVNIGTVTQNHLLGPLHDTALRNVQEIASQYPVLVAIRDHAARAADHLAGIAAGGDVGRDGMMAMAGGGQMHAGGPTAPTVTVQNTFYGDFNGMTAREIGDAVTERMIDEVDRALGSRRLRDRAARGDLPSV